MTISALRTITVPGATSTPYGFRLAPSFRWPAANAGQNLDYSLDLTAPLADIGDSIASVSVSIAPSGAGEMQAVDLAVQGGVVTAQLYGGVTGRLYDVRTNVTTIAGRVLSYECFLQISPVVVAADPPSAGFGTPLNWTSGASVFGTSFMAVADNLVATGTNQATALPLPAQTNIITSAPAGTGCRLSSLYATGTCRVVNAAGADVLVYPPGAAQIGSYGAGVAVIVGANQTVDFSSQTPATRWVAS